MTEDQQLRVECARLAIQAITACGGSSTDVAPAARELYEWVREGSTDTT